MDLGPCLLLTEGKALGFGLWFELQSGALCRIYPAAQYKHAAAEHRAIARAAGASHVTFTSTASLCLITISNAMDAGETKEAATD